MVTDEYGNVVSGPHPVVGVVPPGVIPTPGTNLEAAGDTGMPPQAPQIPVAGPMQVAAAPQVAGPTSVPPPPTSSQPIAVAAAQQLPGPMAVPPPQVPGPMAVPPPQVPGPMAVPPPPQVAGPTSVPPPQVPGPMAVPPPPQVARPTSVPPPQVPGPMAVPPPPTMPTSGAVPQHPYGQMSLPPPVAGGHTATGSQQIEMPFIDTSVPPPNFAAQTPAIEGATAGASRYPEPPTVIEPRVGRPPFLSRSAK